MLSGKCVVLGVSGGIAAYKAAEVASRLSKLGARVRVVMTEHATRFIAPLTFGSITGNQVYVSLFDFSWEIEHIALAKEADLLLIAPCTANVMGKMAGGIADDLLTTTAMAVTAPILLAPAMNVNMWENQATQRNRAVLAERGARFVGPEEGRMACGDYGCGRMSEPEAIVEAAINILTPKRDFAGRRVLVTAGPTREPLDPVRYLTNYSSGKMGYAIAEAAAARGAEVTLVSGPVNLDAPSGVARMSVETTQQLYDEVTGRAPESDIVIQAAAPADYRPEAVADSKIKRGEGSLTITLTPNPDIAAQIGCEKRAGQILVAFAAETNDLVENARGKLIRKNTDLIVANDVTQEGAGFGVDTNRVTLVTRENETELPLLTKREVADAILDTVMAMMPEKP